MLKRIGGVIAISCGVALGAWVVYAVFVSNNPDHKIRRPGKAIGFAVAAVGVGIYWLRSAAADAGQNADSPALDET